jgi:uncharacterized protein YjbJ (UPF0337 family)
MCANVDLWSPVPANARDLTEQPALAPPQNCWEKDLIANWRRGNGEFVTHPHRRSPLRWQETSQSRSPDRKIQEREMVDKDRVKGSAEQAKGKAKEWAGKVTGDAKTENEGKADQVKGKVQNTVGGLKDTVREK